jgi:preprotein translocase subunit SecD
LYTRQGPQDEGGILLVIAVKADGGQPEQSVVRTIAVIEARCNQMGVYCKLQRDGGEQITLRVSGGLTPERVKNILLSYGLEMRAVASRLYPAPLDSYATREEAEAAASADKDVLSYNEAAAGDSVNKKKFIVVERTPVITGEDIRDAHASQVSDNYDVVFSLRPEGAAKLQAWTRANINRYIGVVLNKEARSVAHIRSEISDTGVITGRYTREQAEDIAHVLKTGNLPAPVEVLRESTYKP